MSEVCDRCRRTLVRGDSPPLCSTCRREQYEAYVRQGLVQPTAYDRAQAELVMRIEALEQMQLNMAGNVSAGLDSLGAQAQHLGSLAQMLSSRTIELDRANKRIEALDRIVALHKVVFEKLGVTYEACEGGAIVTQRGPQ